MTQHYHSILAFIKSKVNDSHLAQDLAQEVFLKLSKSGGAIISKSYMYTIARNLVIDHYRKKTPQIIDLNDQLGDLNMEDHNDLMCNMEACLEVYIDKLDHSSKELLTTCDLRGKSQKEYSSTSGISYPTLRSKIQRSRKKMRYMFEQDCHLELSPTGGVISCHHRAEKKSGC